MRRRLASVPLLATLLLAACAPAPVAPPPVSSVVAPPAPPAPVAPPAALAPPAPSEDEGPLPILASDPTWGSRTALVTIIMFGDFQCLFTAKSSKTIRALEDKYGPSGLRIVWKNSPLPFHPRALATAEAAEAVHMLGGNDAFWKFADAAFGNQSQLTPASFDLWAEAAGIDVASFHRLVEPGAGEAKVEQDLTLAKKLTSGTPAFFVNGVPISGAQPEEKFIAQIDAETEKAKARIAAGTSPELLYLAMVKENFKEPVLPPAEPKGQEDTTSVWNIPLAGAPSRGGDTPLVTIVEFSDFQCPYCKRVQPTLEKIQSTYGDKVRIVWRDHPLPFHVRAFPAASLAREARAEKGVAGFWAVHDALFASQPKLEEADLDAIAAGAGLNPAKAHEAITGGKYKRAIDDDANLAVDLKAEGTPSFFLNGRRLVGAQPFEKFQTLIDEEIVHAEDVLSKGTKRAALYETLVKGGKIAGLNLETRTVAAAANAPFKGSAGAKVVIQEFGDFECPFCKAAEAALAEVLRDRGASVKLVWRDLPLGMHPHAKLAAAAAREAQRQKGNDGFWKMHDKLFAGQTAPGLERAALDQYARELGLDLAAFDDALDSGKWDSAVEADAKAAAGGRFNGTPTFLVGGYLVNGAPSAGRLRAAIARVASEGGAKAPAVTTPP